MAEKIIILSDGTGNAASSVWRTNVWRVFQSLNLQGNDQAAKYDDGVGTSAFLPLALLGGAFGWGLKRNVLDAYKFICRNYQSGSKIYLFGFSRGAFTARVLAAFILEQGLVKTSSEGELHDLARKAYRAYRANGYHSIWRVEVLFRGLRDALVKAVDLFLRRKRYKQDKNTTVPTIEFIGVWDTVAAYGLPVDEMTRGVSNWIWPLELPNRELNSRILCARHALALDDERTTFHPVLWTEQKPDDPPPPVPQSIKEERLAQVWFVGMHANVGGGYPDDALAFVPLCWLLAEAKDRGLNFKIEPKADPDTFKWIASSQDKDGRLYDSRAGLGAYYRYGPRKVHDLCNDAAAGVCIPCPKIHESVFGRIDSGANAYAPIGLPSAYVTLKENGDLLPLTSAGSFETADQAKAREAAQERLWNYVWLRRLVYFATLAASLHLAAFWLFHSQNAKHEFDTRIKLVSESVRFVESFLPHSLHWWTDWYAGNPEWFAGGILVLAGLMALGSSLSSTIQDSMRVIWESRGTISPVPHTAIQNVIYKFRRCPAYQWVIRSARLHALPFLFALGFIWLSLFLGSHTIFNVADSMGTFCTGTPKPEKANKGIPQDALKIFDTKALCFATGLTVQPEYTYEITIAIIEPWKDDDAPTSPIGYRTSKRPFLSRLILYPGVFLRRVMFRPWYRLIARIGETGVDEQFLDPWKVNGAAGAGAPLVYKARFKADRSGELFLYVNDAVISFPWLVDFFYRNNHGSAKISVQLL